MSGGYFNYDQYKLQDIREMIQNFIDDNKRAVDSYSDKTMIEFKKAVSLLEQAEIYVQRIDWLICCDDSEETFHERLKEDLEKLKEGK